VFHYIKKKIGTRTRYNTTQTDSTLWFTFAPVTKRGDHTNKTHSNHPKYLGPEQSRGLNPKLQLGTKSCDPL
jgi:hypothetical protein